MKVFIITLVLFTSWSDCASADAIIGNYEKSAPTLTATPIAIETPKFKFILFFKENDATTRALAGAFKPSVTKFATRAEWSAVDVTDSANRELVKRYHIDRAPMPLLLCVAPNGMITEAITPGVFDKTVERALVTPAMLLVAQAIHDGKIVIVHIQHDQRLPLPPGAAGLIADPNFRARTATVEVSLNDPVESRFITELKIKARDVSGSILVILAPPSVVIGKFPASMTKEELVTAIQAAEKRRELANRGSAPERR